MTIHRPSESTHHQVIEPFEAALAAAGQPSPDYDVEQWLYVPNRYRDYRYVLGTCGRHPLIVVGINPSTARPGALDPTLRSAERIALANGFDSFLMFNVYAQRATKPDDMEADCNLFLHGENMKAFAHLLSLSGGAPVVWAAWGTIIEKRPYLADCLRDMVCLGEAAAAVWRKAGPVSKAGHPHHPLYLKKDTALEPFDAEAYLENWC